MHKFYKIAEFSDFPSGASGVLLKKKKGIEVLLIKKGNSVFALENRCGHMGVEMAKGKIDFKKMTIGCPLHGSKFDIVSGNYLRPDNTEKDLCMLKNDFNALLTGMGLRPVEMKPTRTFEVKLDANEIFVKLPTEYYS